MATYGENRRIRRQSASIQFTMAATGTGSNAIQYSAQITMSLPTALYGVLVPRIWSQPSALNAVSSIGLQAWNRANSTYATNIQANMQQVLAPTSIGIGPAIFSLNSLTNSTTLLVHRFVSFDGMNPSFRFQGNPPNAEQIIGCLGFMVFDQDRVQLGYTRNQFIGTAQHDVWCDLYEIY